MNNYYKNKKVAVAGLSVEGIATAKYLLSQNADIVVCDQKTERELSPDIKEILSKMNVKQELGPHYLDHLDDVSLLFRSPGMPLWHPELLKIREKGVVISSLTKLFFDECPCPIIGVTGTKGKGTTTSLIGEILKADGKKVYVGGNIGVPLISQIGEMDEKSIVVLELSSFQLEDLEKSPHIAVVLNVTVDHLASSSSESPNYHKNQTEYINAKKNIVRFQRQTDYAVLNYDYDSSTAFKKNTPADIWYFSRMAAVSKGAYAKNGTLFFTPGSKTEKICAVSNILLRGEHNLENITAAVSASYLAGASLESIRKTIKIFKGLEHRLELVGVVDKIAFYNDSFATTPETTIAALRSFTEPVILIAGGSEKGADFSKLGQEIGENTVKTVILIGMMKDRIKEVIQKAGNYHGKIIEGLSSMQELVKVARQEANDGDVVLLSPACASFDMFKNYKDRGDQFKYEVRKLQDNLSS